MAPDVHVSLPDSPPRGKHITGAQPMTLPDIMLVQLPSVYADAHASYEIGCVADVTAAVVDDSADPDTVVVDVGDDVDAVVSGAADVDADADDVVVVDDDDPGHPSKEGP